MKTRVGIESKPIHKVKADAAALFLFEDEKERKAQLAAFHESVRTLVAPALALGDFKGKEGESLILYSNGVMPAPRLIIVGMGKASAATVEKLRRAAAQAARKSSAAQAESLVIQIPDRNTLPEVLHDPAAVTQALTEGALLALYKFERYVSTAKEKKNVKQLMFLPDSSTGLAGALEGISAGKIISRAVYHARDMENTPASDLYPEILASEARAVGRICGFSTTVLNVKKIASLRMGGVIAVSKGSSHEPRFLILEYGKKFKPSGTQVLVGKGVTFDSGGISLKSAAGMAEMKMDMSGAAAVIGAFEAVAQLKLPVHIIGLIPAVENMPGGGALKPGDILRHYSGKTSEVDNTDAEGRLILADALGFAERFKPSVVVDLATLTGACVVALGHVAAGMLGNDQNEMNAVRDAGEKTYERVWQMPMFDEYEKLIKSEIADVKNAGGRWGGTITAAFFLKKFIGDYPWVHLDIAGTAMLEETTDYATRGGSGFGVRLMTEYLKSKAAASVQKKSIRNRKT